MAVIPNEDPVRRSASEADERPDLNSLLDAVAEDGKGWVEAQKAYTSLIISERLGRVAGMFTSSIPTILFIAIALITGTIALGLWLGKLLGSLPLGFLSVTGIHILLLLCYLLFGRKLVRDRITLDVINAAHATD